MIHIRVDIQAIYFVIVIVTIGGILRFTLLWLSRDPKPKHILFSIVNTKMK